jgi:phospholipase/lecithinase/hemolysin
MACAIGCNALRRHRIEESRVTMTFKSGLRCLAALLAAGLLAACGGGSTEQIEPFEPVSLLVFGDDISVLTKTAPQGRKYSVNSLATGTTALDCTLLPTWIQVLANRYAFVFEECNPAARTDIAGKMYAVPGAKADDFVAQVAAARLAAGGSFNDKDMATVLFGVNDVIDLYLNQYVPNPTPQTADLIRDELTARGARLGQRVNELTRLGPRVILSTMQLMGQTPFALREVIDRGDPGRPALLNSFSNAFNTAMRLNIVNDGRYIGLLELDAFINAGFTNPGGYGLTNVTAAACAVPLPDCTTATLVPNATATSWLWASELLMSATAHQYLGNFAVGRAVGNPF